MTIRLLRVFLSRSDYLFEEGVGLEADFRSFFRLKSVTKLIGTF